MGFDCNKFTPRGKKEQMVVTVCHVNKSNYKRKGLDVFIESAKRLPDIQFVIIGKDTDGTGEQLKLKKINNLSITGALSEDELIRYLSRAKVYAQLSAHEGFGCALAEAMLCECIPVVTDRGSLPEVAGPDAFYVEYGDSEATVENIMKALSKDSGVKYRNRVMALFPAEKREKELLSIINLLIG
jgi:glycosyltransferase involved in cell wall biosynthesis